MSKANTKKFVAAEVAKKATKEKKILNPKYAGRHIGISNSWRVKKVADTRNTKNRVRVDGTEYRSAWEAFQKLKLGSAGQCIKFRKQLKIDGSGEYSGHKFEVLTD